MIYQEKCGVCLVNKPVGYSSRYVLVKACEKLGLPDPSKVGYAGTLDPLASGLLILLSGVARKLQDYFTQHSKEYIGTVFFGASSETDDRDGPIHLHPNPKIPSLEEVSLSLESFQGKIWQKPPKYSAIKIQGKRSHKIARSGESIELKAREVKIFSLQILDYEYPRLSLKIHCSAGTYIRSLARDLGNLLECDGYLESLCRISCGSFSLDNALPLEQLMPESLIPLQEILKNHPKLILPRSCWSKIRNKQFIEISESSHDNPLLWIEDKLVALGRIKAGFLVAESILMPDLFQTPKPPEPDILVKQDL